MFCHVLSPIGKIGTSINTHILASVDWSCFDKEVGWTQGSSPRFSPVTRVKYVRGVDNKYSGSKLTLRDRKTWKFAPIAA